MPKLQAIPVEVGAPPPAAGDFGAHLAVLRQVEAGLERLLAGGEPASLDLSHEPLGPADRRRLQEALGDGEVSARIATLGITEVRETGVRGVWWVTHRNERGALVGELLELAEVPEILRAHPDDIGDSLATLRTRLGSEPRNRDIHAPLSDEETSDAQ
jgi:hydrogenase-1 operon protein HyaF